MEGIKNEMLVESLILL